MENNKTQITDIIKPEVKNILRKMSRLYSIISEIDEELTTLSLTETKKILEEKYKNHKNNNEAINLINKLQKNKEDDISK